MASETKVGLIAGLTFIICFAVILANRGTRELTPRNELRLAGPRGSATGDWQIQSQSASGQHSRAPRRPALARGTDSQAIQDARSELYVTAVARGERVSERLSADASSDHAPSADARGTSLISTSRDADSRLVLLERRLDELAEDLRAAGKASTVRVDGSPPRHVPTHTSKSKLVSFSSSRTSDAPRLARYTVVYGDTLSRIASAHYGRRSARFVNAIFDANRSVLSSPDQLRPGMELVIPAVTEAPTPPSAGSSGKRESETGRPSLPNRQDHPPPSKWYQIKKNDRYVSIAREQLGDARRWPEIHELNKEKFPDPGMIREGVRIRIPQALAVSTGRRR